MQLQAIDIMQLQTIEWNRQQALFSPGEGGVSQGTPERVRVLIVEDEFLAASELEAGLEDAGYAVVGTARSAEEAVNLARSEMPALVVMDVRLIGRGDGVDAALEIFRETGIRCIFATAMHDPRIRQRAAPALPFGWLAKPYTVDAVVRMINRALSELRMGKE